MLLICERREKNKNHKMKLDRASIKANYCSFEKIPDNDILLKHLSKKALSNIKNNDLTRK